MSDEHDIEPAARPDRKRAAWASRIAIGGVALVAVAGVGAAAAQNGLSTFYGPAMHVAMSHGGGMGGGFVQRRFERIMDEIEATPEQAERLRAIFEDAREELMPMREGFHELRGEIAGLLGAPQVDRAAAERLRAERVAAMDQASRRMTEALLDAAEVLTPQQRAALIERFEDRRGGPRGERGWHGRW